MDMFDKNKKSDLNGINEKLTMEENKLFVENATNSLNPSGKEQKKKHKSRLLSYVLVGILCSTITGAAASVTTLNIMKLKSTSNADIKNSSNKILTSNANDNSIKDEVGTKIGQLSVPEIAKKVGPAVVGVSTKGFPKYSDWGFETQPSEGMGSGIIFDEQGYILTNYHVIADAKTIRVIFNNGKEVNAKLVNSNPDYDVAVIKITDKVQVPAVAEFGNSDSIEVGENAVAIGNPLGRELLGSVTAGVVSAVNRNIDGRNKDLKLIQTDAAINPGNSGGPLVNSRGQVIGINTEKRVGQGVEGLGFAIPINQIKPKIQGLMKPKIQDLTKPKLMLGIVVRQVTESDSNQYNYPIGIFITDIMPYSPAEKSGLNLGDIITKCDGKNITNIKDLDEVKNKHKAGDTMELTVWRDGKNINLKIQLSEA